MQKYFIRVITLLLFTGFSISSVSAVDINQYPVLVKLADELVVEHQFTKQEVSLILAQAKIQPSVLKAMQNPAEYRFTWGKYRNLFMKPDRIQSGVDFWKQHKDVLAKAEKTYGVPAEIIVAIIGVESKFGKYKGAHKVLDSLVTLSTGYPRRSKFFTDELKHFLVLTRDNHLDVNSVMGSYAGAVGFPQFISSSYRNYAVDFSGDGKVDLIDQVEDAIGSVANYFKENGWRTGQTVVTPAQAEPQKQIQEKATRKLKPQYEASQLRTLGANLPMSIVSDAPMNVLKLDASDIVNDPKKSRIHHVRAGDTACEIAETYNVPCQQLLKLNKLDRNGTIYRGQRLRLPGDVVKEDMREPIYFYTHHNFYVITRYNRSVLYAMAVYDLSQAIAQQFVAQ